MDGACKLIDRFSISLCTTIDWCIANYKLASHLKTEQSEAKPVNEGFPRTLETPRTEVTQMSTHICQRVTQMSTQTSTLRCSFTVEHECKQRPSKDC